VQVHDKVIIMCYAQLNEKEVESHKPLVVFVDENNKISHIKNYEKHGLLVDQD
jgi:aspartate 1-decarboxylase